MNIFILDKNIEKCAQYHCDSHVVKMILESAQILCTVLWQTGTAAPYRPTHLKHPCVIWAGESLANWLWLKELGSALNKEYQYRFNKSCNHKSYDIIKILPIPSIPNLGLTKHVQVVPEMYRSTNVINAYRQYYIHHKKHIAKWTKRKTPHWFSNKNVIV